MKWKKPRINAENHLFGLKKKTKVRQFSHPATNKRRIFLIFFKKINKSKMAGTPKHLLFGGIIFLISDDNLEKHTKSQLS
jgi:hypothetical protein